MDSSAVEQEREIRDLIRRAERTPVPTNPLRRDALKRLIKLSRAPQASLKKLAADNISKFFKVFPDLEEDAINAIYDLCEDQDFKVRADGYKAIVNMSKQQPKWVKRNADVLVQLLQSDEQEEVTRVKRSLASHLDLNAVVTLGVLCDQIVPQDAPLDEDDKAMRDRLRMLVIAFICNDAKQSIVERHASKAGSQPENVLIEGLLKAVSKLGPSDAEKIIKDILLYLPSFQGRFTSRGNELLLVLLDRAKSSLEEDLSTGNDCTTLQRTRSFLDLALFLSVERSVSDPSHVLRFYGDSSLAKRDTQERLSKDARVFLMMFIADVWTACGDISEFGSNQMRRLISTASLTLLPAFVEAAPSDQRSWRACEQLLSLCCQRIDETSWRAPTVFNRTLDAIYNLAGQQRALKVDRVQTLAKSIMDSSQPPNGGRPSPPGPRRSPLPSKPLSSASGKRKSEDQDQTPPEQHRKEGEKSLSIRGQSQREVPQQHQRRLLGRPTGEPPTTTEGGPSTSSRVLDEDAHPAKRPRTMLDESRSTKNLDIVTPPLLQRLQSAEQARPQPARLPPKPPPQLQSVSSTQGLPKQELIRPPLSRSPGPPVLTPAPLPPSAPGGGGLTIKGAARDLGRTRPPLPSSTSLLDRINGQDRDSLGEPYGKTQRRKKRGWP